MALAYQTTTTKTIAAGAAGSINVPSGTQNGDLLLLMVAAQNAGDVAAPAGWTLVKSITSGNPCMGVWSRVASSEPASYQIATNAAGVISAGMSRIVGDSVATVTDQANGQLNSASTTCTSPGVTPTVANNMLLFYCAASGATASFSAYAVVTSSPTFTEAWNFSNGAAGAAVDVAMAYGSRSAVTATGNATATVGSSLNNTGILISLVPQPDQTATVSLYTLSARLLALPFLVPLLEVAAHLFDPISSIWRNVSKSSTTWTDVDKS